MDKEDVFAVLMVIGIIAGIVMGISLIIMVFSDLSWASDLDNAEHFCQSENQVFIDMYEINDCRIVQCSENNYKFCDSDDGFMMIMPMYMGGF